MLAPLALSAALTLTPAAAPFLKESPWTNMIMRKIYDFCWVEVPAPFFKRLIQPAITFLLKMYVHENAILSKNVIFVW